PVLIRRLDGIDGQGQEDGSLDVGQPKPGDRGRVGSLNPVTVRDLDLGRDLAGEIDDDNERAGTVDGALGTCGGVGIEGAAAYLAGKRTVEGKAVDNAVEGRGYRQGGGGHPGESAAGLGPAGAGLAAVKDVAVVRVNRHR